MAEAGRTDNGVAAIVLGKYSASRRCVQRQVFGVFWGPTGGMLDHDALLAVCRSRAGDGALSNSE
jgi:hypothetical protein